MNNPDNIFNYIFMVVFTLISLWGTYKLTRPYKSENKNKDCKCSK